MKVCLFIYRKKQNSLIISTTATKNNKTIREGIFILPSLMVSLLLHLSDYLQYSATVKFKLFIIIIITFIYLYHVGLINCNRY